MAGRREYDWREEQVLEARRAAQEEADRLEEQRLLQREEEEFWRERECAVGGPANGRRKVFLVQVPVSWNYDDEWELNPQIGRTAVAFTTRERAREHVREQVRLDPHSTLVILEVYVDEPAGR
jgi:hypothetical protein